MSKPFIIRSLIFDTKNLTNISKLVKETKDLNAVQTVEKLLSKGVAEEEIKATLAKRGYTEATIESTVAGKTSNVTKDAETVKNKTLSTSFKELATSIGISTTALGVITGAIAVLGAGFVAYKIYKQSMDDAVSSASDASSVYQQHTSSIKSQIDAYKDLRTQLIAANGDTEKVSSIKSQFLDLQKQINEEFGNEYGRVNLVTDAYKDQTSVLKEYNKASAESLLAKDKKGIDEAKRQMTSDKTFSLGSSVELSNLDANDVRKQILAIAKKYEDDGISITTSGIEFTGKVEDADKVITQFSTDVRNLKDSYGDTSQVITNVFDDALDKSSQSLQKTSDIISTYQNIYQQSQLAKIASSDKMSSKYNEMTDAVLAYNDAVSNSDNPYGDENVKTAYDNLEKIKGEIADDSDWNAYGDIVDKTFADADTSSYSFYEALRNNSDGVNDLAQQLNELSDTDIQSMIDDGDNGDAWDKLAEKAKEYGLSVEDLINLLEQLGIVQEDAAKNAAGGDTPALSFADTISQVEALSAGLDQLDKIYADVYNKEDFDWSSILNNENFDKVFGNMGSVYDDFIQTVSNTPDDLSACQDSFNRLTTAYINNGTALNTVTDATKATTIAMLEEQGVSNATAMVGARLEANKYALANGCRDLSEATYQEISALLQDADASSTATQYIAQLALAKVDLNNTQLKTEDDVNAIISIANAAGASFGQLAALKDAMASLTSFSTKIHGVSFTGDMNDINTTQDALNTLKNTWSDIQNGSYQLNPADYYAKYTGGSATKAAVDKANKDSSKSAKKEFSETVDWLEKMIDHAKAKADKAIDAIDKKLSLKSARKAISKALKETSKELDVLQLSKKGYQDHAESVGLANAYRSAVENGTYNIETITDENLKNQIDEYEKWYNKIVECDDAISDLKDKQKELNAQKLSKITDFYDISAKRYSSATDIANANIDYKKSKGKEIKTSDYKSVISSANKEASVAKAEYAAYSKEVNAQIKQGILKGSDKTEALTEVNNLKQAWIEAQQAVLDYKDEQKQIKLDNLSAALDRLSAKGDTTQNKIDLKVASGGTESKKEYQNLISNSKTQVKNLQSQNKELIRQQKGLSKNSEKYRELQSQIESNTSAIYDAKIQQVEWNATIRDMPNDKLNKALETLQKIHSVYDSLLGLREAQGRKKTDSEILKEISNNNSEIKNLETQKKSAENNLKKARDEESKAKSKVSNYQDDVGYYDNRKGSTTSEYKSQLKRINSQISLAQDKLAIAKKAGKKQEVSELTEQIKELQTRKTILTDSYNDEMTDLNKRLATAKQNLADAQANSDKSSDIKKYQDAIADAEKSILDLKTENEGLLDEMIQNRIDAYQDELDELNKQNEARQKALDIEKAQYELEKSKNQRDKKVFNGSQFVYKSDASTIRTNQETLDKLNFTDLTDSIQDLIDELESMKDSYNLYDEDGNTLNAKTIISSMQSAANSLVKSIAEALKSAGLDVTIPTFSKGGNINGTISPLARKLGEDVIVSAKIGERILTPEQNANWEQWTKALPDLMTYMSPLKDFTPPDYSNLVTKNVTTNMPIESHVTFNCPNVTDKAVCDYVMTELENEFNKLGAKAQQRYSKVGK